MSASVPFWGFHGSDGSGRCLPFPRKTVRDLTQDKPLVPSTDRVGTKMKMRKHEKRKQLLFYACK